MDLVERARTFALEAYGSEARLEHPADVARLVDSVGAADPVVAAALLHDILEDTDADPAQIAGEFGSRVAALVSALTEDESIRRYSERKEDLRMRVSAAGADATLIAVADKLSRVRQMRRGDKGPKERKLAHYEAMLALARRDHPGLPLLDRLGKELAALRADLNRAAA